MNGPWIRAATPTLRWQKWCSTGNGAPRYSLWDAAESHINEYMRKMLAACLYLVSCSSLALAQAQFSDPMSLLDHLTGSWLLKGKIAGKQTTHDVQAHWVLRHEYLEIHEVSREKDGHGEPAYEAIVLVSWEPKTHQYSCLWLDSTAGGALSSQVTCRATPSGASIPFVFVISPSDSIHTTFSYRKASDTWQWLIDNVTNGKSERFAALELSKTK